MPRTERHRLLGQVHMEKSRCGLDEDEYRDLLESLTGKRSAKELENPELERVIIWLRNKFPYRDSLPQRYSPKTRHKANHTVQDKCVALWIECWKAGLVKDGSHDALLRFCERQLGKKIARLPNIDPLQALSPGTAYKVIEVLKIMLAREQNEKKEERA